MLLSLVHTRKVITEIVTVTALNKLFFAALLVIQLVVYSLV